MRIALISVSGELGGSESSLWQLVGAIRRLAPAAEPTVVVPRDGPLASRVRSAGASVSIMPMPDALASFGEWSMRGPSAVARRSAAMLAAAGAIGPYGRALRGLLAGLEPDVIHTNGFKAHVLGTRAAPRDVPVVWHVHEYVSRRPLSRALLRHYVSRAAAIVANSRSVAADVRVALGDDAPVTTTYNAVDLDDFAPAGPAANLDALAALAPAEPGTIRVGLVATFALWKGHETFLRAIRELPAGLPVRGYIVGGPVYDTGGSQHTIEGLRALADSLGVSRRIGFTGFVDRPADAIRALDIVVHASTEPEPFGLVIAEGLACAKPVVVSAAGGAAELVDDGEDALTVPPGDAAALARAIARLAGDASLRARLGAAGRRTAVGRFDPDAFGRSFLDTYERAADRARTVLT